MIHQQSPGITVSASSAPGLQACTASRLFKMGSKGSNSAYVVSPLPAEPSCQLYSLICCLSVLCWAQQQESELYMALTFYGFQRRGMTDLNTDSGAEAAGKRNKGEEALTSEGSCNGPREALLVPCCPPSCCLWASAYSSQRAPLPACDCCLSERLPYLCL